MSAARTLELVTTGRAGESANTATEDILGRASTSLVSTWRRGLIACFVRLSYRGIGRRSLNNGAREVTELVEPRPGGDEPLAAVS